MAKGNFTFTILAGIENRRTEQADFSISVGEGTVLYSGSELKAAVNRESGESVAKATNVGAEVTYTIKSGTLPAGLSFNSDGNITGKPTTLGEEKTFTVTAASKDCVPADATFTIRVVIPWLEFNNSNLPVGRIGEYYGEQLPAPKGAENDDSAVIKYSLKSGSVLPAGLDLEADGFVSGRPTAQVTRYQFSVTVSAQGYTSADANITITIRTGATGGETEDGIITYPSAVLPVAYVGETYNEKNIVAKANASNREYIAYSLSEESSLPAGFQLLENGTIRTTGKVTAPVGNTDFSVVASANGCTPKTAQFTLVVAPEKLIYKSMEIDQATVGTAYSYSVAKASTPNGVSVPITYNLKDDSNPPDGLSLSKEGLVTGTPNKSFKSADFIVIASAEGYSSVQAEIYIKIRDAVTTVSNGLFEAEYLDLTGMVGGGYSGSAQEEYMVQQGTGSASNNYFVGFTHGVLTFEYKITSSQAVTGASLKIRLASEIGTITLTPSIFAISVNENEISYGSMQVTGAGTSMGSFQEFTVTSSGLSLKQGENSIKLHIKSNNLLNGNRVGGPAIDYIKIENFAGSTLSWRPCKYNLNRFTQV